MARWRGVSLKSLRRFGAYNRHGTHELSLWAKITLSIEYIQMSNKNATFKAIQYYFSKHASNSRAVQNHSYNQYFPSTVYRGH